MCKVTSSRTPTATNSSSINNTTAFISINSNNIFCSHININITMASSSSIIINTSNISTTTAK